MNIWWMLACSPWGGGDIECINIIDHVVISIAIVEQECNFFNQRAWVASDRATCPNCTWNLQRTLPRLCEIGWKSCVLFTYCRQENAIFHPLFSQPGKHSLEIPCRHLIFSFRSNVNQSLHWKGDFEHEEGQLLFLPVIHSPFGKILIWNLHRERAFYPDNAKRRDT